MKLGIPGITTIDGPVSPDRAVISCGSALLIFQPIAETALPVSLSTPLPAEKSSLTANRAEASRFTIGWPALAAPQAPREDHVIEQLGRTRNDEFAWMKFVPAVGTRTMENLPPRLRQHLQAERDYAQQLLQPLAAPAQDFYKAMMAYARSVVHAPAVASASPPAGRCWGTNTAVSRWMPGCALNPTTALRWSGCCAIARVHRFPWSAYAKREANWCTAVPNNAASPPVTSAVPRQMSCTSHRWN